MTGTWESRRLGTLLKLTSGQSPSGFRFGASGTPYYKVEQLGRSGKHLGRGSTPYFSMDVPRVPASSVLIAKRGAAIALNRIRLIAEPSFMDTNIMALTPSAELDPEFLYYWLSYRGLWDIADVTSVPQINNKHIVPLVIPLPSLDEQERIVAVLRDFDDLIDTRKRQIAKKQAIKQGTAQRLLSGRTRLSGHSAEWNEAQLGQYGRCVRGVAYDPERDLAGSDRPTTLRLLRANNVQDGVLMFDELQFVEQRRVSRDQVLAENDIVICMANGSRALVGKSALFQLSLKEPRYTFGAFMAAFRTSKKADPRYLAQLLLGKQFRDWLDVILAGSSINNLRPRDVEAFTVAMPPLDEQSAIADVLADADAEIELLKQRVGKAEALKAGVAQQLLTAKTRLPEAEAVA